MATLPSQTTGALGAGDAVLALRPPLASGESPPCHDLVESTASAPVDVLGIAYGRSAEERFERWTQRAGGRVADATLLSVDVTSRSAASAPDGRASDRQSFTVRPVSPPEDVTNLGREVVDQLDRLGDDRQLAVCFDSLTALLQYAHEEKAFKFAKLLLDRLTAAEAAVHCHMDSMAHDEKTVATFAPLFDAVFEYDRGEWTVHS